VIRPEDGPSVITYICNKMLISHLPACMQFKQTTIGVKPAPIMASYASRGPSRYFPNILKLDIIRSLVLAASSSRSTTAHIAISNMPVNDAYILSSGTSFACCWFGGAFEKCTPRMECSRIEDSVIDKKSTSSSTDQDTLDQSKFEKGNNCSLKTSQDM
jgi:hypothetical protein